MWERAQELLQEAYGAGATFRTGQWEAIESLVVRRERVLVVQRTGWGKSLVYFLATRLLRDAGSGPTLIVSPLLSLMRNQLEAATRIRLAAATINSTNREDWVAVKEDLRHDAVDLLLISPEQLGSDHFAAEVLPEIQGAIGLLVVDEAHCISDWGHDFRPDYRRIVGIVRQLPRNMPLLGTTATANQRVVDDVATQLGPGLRVIRGPLVRESLVLQTIVLADQAERLAWLAEYLPGLPGTGIIYCLTIADCERVSGWLSEQGIDAPAYHAKLTPEERQEREGRLQHNQCKALVATVALGMGYDKPDLGFVVHYQRPGSVVAYYQQVGRAGRAVEQAYAILLNGREDDEIQEYFIDRAFPTAEDTRRVLRVLERESGMTRAELLGEVNLSQTRVDQILKLLQIEDVVGKDGSTYFRTTNPHRLDRPEEGMITQLRKEELARMAEFVRHPGCLMEFIERELDDPDARPCGRCAGCTTDPFPSTVNHELVRNAIRFLQRDNRVIEPRKQWPAGEYAGRHGKIPQETRAEEGRALCLWGDAGWGRLVRAGKYEDNHFDDQLALALADMIRDDWRPEPAPAWVSAVPSLKHPALVADLARRLAEHLGLTFAPVLQKVSDTPAQKTMQNSAQQARNALDAFAVTGTCPRGPVLLVDDIVDSRWTLTICAVLLREAGSGPVFPVALASAAGGGDPD